MKVEDKIKEIIIEQLGVKPEDVIPDADFVNDLGCDSLDAVELVMSMEEKFNIEISDDEAERLKTVNDVIVFVTKKLN